GITSVIGSKRQFCRFGILCLCLATNNSLILVLYSTWYDCPFSELYESEGMLYPIREYVGGTFWIVGIRLHLLISINRFIAIIYPFKLHKYFHAKGTAIAVFVVILASALQCAPIIILDGVWFCFDKGLMQWIFAPTRNGKIYE
ncbi:hypothetical protein PMAYCL1PPCAC_16148, partial [Pristionchus mayeri]